MSLLATKSWNPRNAKNRARVERDEAEAKAEESKSLAYGRKSDAEWQYERLKTSSSSNKAITGAFGSVSPTLAVETDKIESMPHLTDSAPHPTNVASKSPSTHGTPLGGTKRSLKPWYEYEEYALPSSKKASTSSVRDVQRNDPLTLMSQHDHSNGPKDSKSFAHRSVKERHSPLSAPDEGKTVIQKLREERLQREKLEKEKASKLLKPVISQPTRGRMTRYGPLRGHD
jgi:hypothetical protein